MDWVKEMVDKYNLIEFEYEKLNVKYIFDIVMIEVE